MSGSGGDNVASTSTSTARASLSEEVHREIEALFNWNPRRLESHFAASSTKATSKSTRPPAYYDKRFSNKMALLRVKRLPSLVQQLQKNVDHTLLAASATLPRKWQPLIPTVIRDFVTRRTVSNVAQDEKDVAEIYGKTTTAFCVPLASTLALHPKASKDEWENVLHWTQSVSSSGYDGELQIIRGGGNNGDFDRIVGTMDPETRGIVKEMRNSVMSLGTWEFKSLATGSDDVMKSVHGLGDFPWTICSEEACNRLPLHSTQVDKATKTFMGMGHDAQNPPWTLDVCSFIPKLVEFC